MGSTQPFHSLEVILFVANKLKLLISPLASNAVIDKIFFKNCSTQFIDVSSASTASNQCTFSNLAGTGVDAGTTTAIQFENGANVGASVISMHSSCPILLT